MKLKKLLLLLALYFTICSVSAQNANLVIFSNQGYPFTLILNGVRQNQKPVTNVKVTYLNQPAYKAKVIFQDSTMENIDKTIYLKPDFEVVYEIQTNNKGNLVIKPQSLTPLAQLPPAPPGQTIIVYGRPSAPVASSTTVTTTTTAVPNNSVNVNANVGGTGINMNVNTGGYNTSMTGSTTTTMTTTTTTTGQPNYPPPHHDRGGHYRYANGCYGPMPPSNFADAKRTISNQSFASDKLKVAKQVLNSNCMSSEQVKEVMGLFSFESDKLNFAKYAYGHTTDPQNFYKLNDAFSYSSSVDELNSYINSHR